jgi:hypothetical protein
MKIILLFLITSLSISSYSQVDRRIGRGQYERSPKNSQKTKVDFTEQSLEFFRKEIGIDGFQEAIVRNLIKENQAKSKEIIEAVSYSDIEKRNLLTELGEKFNVEIKKILQPEQIEKYEKLISKNKK